jgi:hypothetical protein
MVRNIGQANTASPPAMPQHGAFFPRLRASKIGFTGNHEPALAELLIDPILHRLLQSDGIKPDALIDLIADVKVRMARRQATA